MTEYKKTWRVVVVCDSEQSALNRMESVGTDAYVEEAHLPIIKWNNLEMLSPLALGYSWRCEGCNKLHMFNTAYKGHTYNCKVCGKEHYSDWSEDEQE